MKRGVDKGGTFIPYTDFFFTDTGVRLPPPRPVERVRRHLRALLPPYRRGQDQ